MLPASWILLLRSDRVASQAPGYRSASIMHGESLLDVDPIRLETMLNSLAPVDSTCFPC